MTENENLDNDENVIEEAHEDQGRHKHNLAVLRAGAVEFLAALQAEVEQADDDAPWFHAAEVLTAMFLDIERACILSTLAVATDLVEKHSDDIEYVKRRLNHAGIDAAKDYVAGRLKWPTPEGQGMRD